MWHAHTCGCGQWTQSALLIWTLLPPPHIAPNHTVHAHTIKLRYALNWFMAHHWFAYRTCIFPFWRQFTRKLRWSWPYHTSAERCQCTPFSHVDHTQPHTHTQLRTTTHNHTQPHTTTHNHTQPHTVYTHMHGNVYIYICPLIIFYTHTHNIYTHTHMPCVCTYII